MNAFVSRGRFVVGDGEDKDELTASGEWIATAEPVEVER